MHLQKGRPVAVKLFSDYQPNVDALARRIAALTSLSSRQAVPVAVSLLGRKELKIKSSSLAQVFKQVDAEVDTKLVRNEFLASGLIRRIDGTGKDGKPAIYAIDAVVVEPPEDEAASADAAEGEVAGEETAAGADEAAPAAEAADADADETAAAGADGVAKAGKRERAQVGKDVDDAAARVEDDARASEKSGEPEPEGNATPKRGSAKAEDAAPAKKGSSKKSTKAGREDVPASVGSTEEPAQGEVIEDTLTARKKPARETVEFVSKVGRGARVHRRAVEQQRSEEPRRSSGEGDLEQKASVEGASAGEPVGSAKNAKREGAAPAPTSDKSRRKPAAKGEAADKSVNEGKRSKAQVAETAEKTEAPATPAAPAGESEGSDSAQAPKSKRRRSRQPKKAAEDAGTAQTKADAEQPKKGDASSHKKEKAPKGSAGKSKKNAGASASAAKDAKGEEAAAAPDQSSRKTPLGLVKSAGQKLVRSVPLPRALARAERVRTDIVKVESGKPAKQGGRGSNGGPARKLNDDVATLVAWIDAAAEREVPYASRRQRAYEIFNDEKAFEGKRGERLFRRLSEKGVNTMALRITPNRPVHFTGFFNIGSNRPFIMVENLDTYDEIVRLLRGRKNAKLFGVRVGGVIFGAGCKAAVAHALDDYLAEIGYDYKFVYYAGDIDREGAKIVEQTRAANTTEVRLHAGMYKAMLAAHRERIKEGRLCEAASSNQGVPQNLALVIRDLPVVTRVQFRNVLRAGGRIPQEILTSSDYRDSDSGAFDRALNG